MVTRLFPLLVLPLAGLLLTGADSTSTAPSAVQPAAPAAAKRSDPALHIEQTGGPSPWTHLRLRNDPADFQFAIVSDRTGGPRPGIFEDAVRKLNLLQPEFVMSVGDFIEGYTTDTAVIDAQWKEFNGFVQQLEMPFFYVPGNHDHTNPVMAEEWKKRFGRPYYHFVYRDVLFLCMNSEDPRARFSKEQIDYFARVLEENKSVRWTLAFFHQPLWLNPTATDDGAVYDGSGWKDFEALLAGRRYTIFAGHLHQYMNGVRNGQKHIILASTGGGSALRGPRNYGEFDHVVWVTMRDDGPVIANLMLDGIRDENIRSERVASLVNPLARSAIQSRTVFVDSGSFTSATTQLRLTNDADLPLTMRIALAPSGPLRAKPTVIERVIPPNSVEFADVALVADAPMHPSELPGPLALQWSGAYDVPGEPRVEIEGTASIGVDAKFSCAPCAGAVTVDGRLDEWKDLPFGRRAVADSKGTWQGPDDCSYRFATAYDDNFLYVAVETADDRLVLRPGKLPWEQDGIEVRLDARPDPQRSRGRGQAENDAFVLFAMSPGDTPEQMTLYQKDKLPSGSKAVCVKTPAGMTAEVAIPREYLDRMQKESWKELRLNVAVDDVDDEEESIASLLWWRPDWRSGSSYEGSGTFLRREP